MRCWPVPLLLVVSCASPSEAPPPPDDSPWLALELPERVRSSVALAEFRGRVAGSEPSNADVVLVIDLTNTTLEASGVDADGDGVLGIDRPWARQNARTDVRWQRPAESWTSDFDDAIVSVELAAALRLVDALGGRHCRIGIVTFTGKPRVLVEVGAPEAARAALEQLRVPVDRTGTLPKLALRRAGQLLDDAPRERGPQRRPAIVFLSDGAETNRQQQRVRRDAERAAAELWGRGIAVHALGFGADEAQDPEIMGRIAAFGRGRYRHVDRPEDALGLVAPPTSIAELTVRNTARPDDEARAVRSFADGSFDGFVPLAPGENAIELEVVLGDGRRVRTRRSVHYEPIAGAGDAELLEALRERTAETELAGESQSGAVRRRTHLEIQGEAREREAEPAGPPGAAH
jgi:hypothetical protein